MWWWAVAARAAVPAPEFVGASPADAALLSQAWQGVAACTGWNAPHPDRLEIVYGAAKGGWGGHAHVIDGVVDSIALHPGYTPRTIVHEVAHAWLSFRPHTPPPLDEGLTELLTDCVARHRPDLGVTPRNLDGAGTTNLWAWTKPETVPGSSNDAGYDSALRLAQLAAEVVGENPLWPRPTAPFLDWFWFAETLASVSPSPAHWAVLEAIGPSIEDADLDGDGVATRDERADGTLPWDWDTDGDGSPDGQARRRDKVLVPVDGAPVCSGWRAKDDAAEFSFVVNESPHRNLTVEVRAPGVIDSAIQAVAVRAGDALYVTAMSAREPRPRVVATVGLEARRGLERDPECAVPGRLMRPEDIAASHVVFVRPPSADVERWIDDAMKAGFVAIGTAGDHTRVPVDSVRDPISAVDAVSWAWVPDRTTVFQRARGGVVALWIAGVLGIEARAWQLHTSDRIVLADVADQTASHPDADVILAGWLARIGNRLTPGVALEGRDFAAVSARLRSYPDDKVLQALDALARKPFRPWDGWPEPRRPSDVTTLSVAPKWQCSGWRSAGNPLFDVSLGGQQGTLELTSWISDGRVVHGVGEKLEIWRAGGIRDVESCGEAAGLVWVTTSLDPAPKKLLAALSVERRDADPRHPIVVQLGGPHTEQWNGGVIVSDAVMVWGSSTGRWDVVAAGIDHLADATAKGIVVDESSLQAALAPRFGTRLPEFLGTNGG